MSPSETVTMEGSSVLCGGLGGAKRRTPQHLNCIVDTGLHSKDGEKSDQGGHCTGCCQGEGRVGQLRVNKADGVEDRVKSRAGREMVPAFTQEGRRGSPGNM